MKTTVSRLALALLLLLALGCAHAHLKQYDATSGVKICDIQSWVMGTGETEQVTNACGDYASSTQDTGFSDNAEPVLGAITEAAMKGIVPLP